MNIKGDQCVSRHLLSAIALYITQQNWKCSDIRNWQYKEFSSQTFGVVGPLREKLDFLIPWDLRFKDIVITRPPKSSSIQSEFLNNISTTKFGT